MDDKLIFYVIMKLAFWQDTFLVSCVVCEGQPFFSHSELNLHVVEEKRITSCLMMIITFIIVIFPQK